MATPHDDVRTSPELLRIEAAAERAQAEVIASSKDRLGERCPECGALGSLEVFDGVTRCIDCDVTLAATQSLGGLGRK